MRNRAGMVALIRQKYETVTGSLTQRSRRLWAGAEATALGHGGIAVVREATGLARNTIVQGQKDAVTACPTQRVRRPGGRRKPALITYPALAATVEALVVEETRGDPGRTSLSDYGIRPPKKKPGVRIGKRVDAQSVLSVGLRKRKMCCE